MRDAKRISYFRRAVLLTLALPACGGSGASLADGGVGGPQDATPIPTTACGWAPGVRNACDWYLTFTGDPTTCAGFNGSGTAAQCLAVCGRTDTGQAPDSCYVGPDGVDASAGTLSCYATTSPCHPVVPPGNGGRRPGYFASLGFGPPAAGREVGTHFARVACMEAGSIEAFRSMRDELVAHGAPKRLVRAAERAIRDEMRHVRQTAALARRFGEEPIAPLPVPLRAIRPLVEMALENAVEGCVRETYSALECAWQAEVAADPVVRATMKRIARDEMRHLALAWAVHSWAKGRLGPDGRARVLDAQRDAIATLRGELRGDPHVALVRDAGLPLSYQSQALVLSIESKLAA